MPGLVQKNAPIGNASTNLSSWGSVSANGIWSKHRTDITFDQLQKFWSELSPQARQDLLRIDKQTLFEQARKNFYCSRCNGLLLERFTQIVMYGKSLQQEGSQDEVQDPSMHPWGGLAATRDGILTLLDCFIDRRSLKALQNVFDSARARERERELLYPDACGGGGRGWISQGMAGYGRGHGTRETCALHTARLSCDTLVDFWSALGDETRHSLLRMKEEDFIERLMYRFDSKRFCRDCRRNVIREFKELKELKRMHQEPRCTNWFCVADTAFQYEVSIDTIQADWHQSFTDTIGTYHHFEWAVGTGEGKFDILEFENVGMNGYVQVNGLDLGGLSSCFITLRAWRLDGRCTELSVKAHALKGQPCVHRRLIVGDGFVTIIKGDSIRRFFEHAEEAEEEEDDDSMDKDGNDPDGDSSRSQKHAKSPELAREFLLDAATVIFKDQVEKAFREGTARQNAHSIFVCLALKLLEERVHVACKEIITLEKQIKLLEEEEKEKQEEEERKERRRTKEREKKLRRKERLKGKDRKCADPKQVSSASDLSGKESCLSAHEEQNNISNSGDSISETGENTLSSPVSSDNVDAQSSIDLKEELLEDEDDNLHYHPYNVDDDLNLRDSNDSFMMEQSKSSRRKLRFRKDSADLTSRWCDRRRSFSVGEGNVYAYDSVTRSYGHMLASSRGSNGMHKPIRSNTMKSNPRICGLKYGEKFHCTGNRTRDRYESHSCSCNQHNGYRPKDGPYVPITRSSRDFKNANKLDSGSDLSTRPFYRNSKFNHGYVPDSCATSKAKITNGSIPPGRGEVLHSKKVWEPTESRKRCPRSNSSPDVTLRSSDGNEKAFRQPADIQKSVEDSCSYRISDTLKNGQNDDGDKKSTKISNLSLEDGCENGFGLTAESRYYLKNGASEEVGLHALSSSDPVLSSSSSDNCSSCLSEGDSTTGSSGAQNAESSCTSDSEDTSQQSEGRETSTCTKDPCRNCLNDSVDGKIKGNGQEPFTNGATYYKEASFNEDQPLKNGHRSDNGRVVVDMGLQQLHMLQMHNQSVPLPPLPLHSARGYYHQTPASWTTGPTSGLLQFSQPNRYLFAGSLSYSPSTNRSSHFSLQYGATTQPVATPVLTVGRIPLYPMANKANGVNCKDQTERSTSGRDQVASSVAATAICECPLKGPLPDDQLIRNNGKEGTTAKSRDECSNFSLFHFGGPVATPVKDDSIPELSKLAAASVQVDRSCSEKETSVEEYSLFAASNGSKFPFF